MEKIKKLVHLNKHEIQGLDIGVDIDKILNIKGVGKVQLTIRSNGEWGIEKP